MYESPSTPYREKPELVASNVILEGIENLFYGSGPILIERVKGIEPSSSAWKAVALPLSYTRKTKDE